MEKRIFSWLILLTFCTCGKPGIQSQSFSIHVTIKNSKFSSIYLAAVKGDTYKIIDTAVMQYSACTFQLAEKMQPGVYKLIPDISLKQQGGNSLNSIDIIVNHENIRLSTVFPFLADSLQFLESVENNIYKHYLDKESLIQTRLEVLHPMLVNYPRGDAFYGTLVKQYNQLQTEKQQLIRHIADSLPHLFASRLIAMQQSPCLDAGLPEPERLAYYKQHYFDSLDFGDAELINSNAYTHSVFQYVMLYRTPGLTQPELEKEFMKAVDVILLHISSNPEVYDFLLNYLMEGFEQLKMDNVLKYIADKYANTVCTSDNSSTLQRRLDSYNLMAIGRQAPDIVSVDQESKRIKFSAVNNEYTLVVFWASWCPHCNEFMPRLKQWYDHRQTDVEVFAVSLDTVRNNWTGSIRDHGYTWVNGCDFMGWNGKAAQEYYLYATPTMFLLDRNRRILAKPLNMEQFLWALKELVVN